MTNTKMQIRPPLLAVLVFALVALSFLLPAPLHSQSTYGAIVGTVTDASNAAIEGATVAVTNLATGEKHSVKADASGNYSVVNLLPDNYKVDAEKANFKHFVRQPVTVPVGVTVRVDMSLQVGATSETIEVTSQAPLLQTDSGTLSTEVQGETVEAMPLNGRNSMNLLALAAGVVPQGSTQGTTAMNQTNTGHTNWQGWNNYQIGGSLAGESSVYLDGAPNNTLGGNTIGLIMTQDAVQEFNVASNNMTADFGRNGGAVVNMASKGGTNSLHGSVYEYFRNRFLNANEFFNKQAEILKGTPNKPLQWNQNQYGVAVGGPVKKDKMFYNFTWEGFKAITSSSQPSVVPTTNQQNGIIPDQSGAISLIDTGASTYTVSGTSYTGAGFSSCNITHANGVYTITNLWSSGCGDPMAKIIRAYYPEPTPGYSVSGNNFFIAPSTKDNQNQYNGRGDYVVSAKQRIFARYTYWSLTDTGQATLGDANGWPTRNAAAKDTAHQAVLGDTYTFSPSTVLDVRLSYLRQISYDSIPESLGIDPNKFAGTYYPNVASLMGDHVIPAYNVGGQYYSFQSGRGITALMTNYNNTYAVTASLTKIKGNHNVKVGTELRLMNGTNVGGMGQMNSGQFSFSGAFTGDAWADFLLGYIKGTGTGSATGSLGETRNVTSYNYYQAYYVTDSWQAMHRLTLTLGLRWELPGGIFERHNSNTVLLPNYQWTTSAGVNVTGALGLVNSSLYSDKSAINIKHDLFAPRVGFAYRVGNNSAVRGGYGLSYIAVDTKSGTMAQSSSVNNWTTPCGSNNYLAIGKATYYIPDSTQLMYNCFTTSNIVMPPGRTYNGGDLITKLKLVNSTSSLSAPLPQQKYPYVQQWNLSVSHQFKGDTMVELGYAGAKGTHMPSLGTNFNQLSDSVWLGKDSTTNSALLANAYCAKTGTTITVGQCDRPYPWYGTVSDSIGYTASSIYHAMQFKAEKRFRSGGTLMGNYTWAKTIGNTDSSIGSFLEVSSGGGSGGGIQDYNNLKAERAVMEYDVPQRAVISYILSLPFGKGQRWGNNVNSVTDHIISGWGINGITTFQKGFHLAFADTTISNQSLSTYNASLSAFGFGSQRPMVNPSCGGKTSGLTGSYADRVIAGTPQFNTSCWVQPANWTPGNEPRVNPNLFAQGIDNFDFSAIKTTNVTERVKVQFRAEFFNLFNRIQFAPPPTSFGQTSSGVSIFGVIQQTANQPRLIQLSLRTSF